MKRGAKSFELTGFESKRKKSKKNENNIPRNGLVNSAFKSVPNEIISHIMSFLPAYAHFGNNSIHQICYAWNQNIRKLPSITSESIVASCHSENDAVNILKDQSLCQHLTLNDYLEIVSWVPAITKKILTEIPIVNFSSKQLAILGLRSEESFVIIIDQMVSSPPIRTNYQPTEVLLLLNRQDSKLFYKVFKSNKNLEKFCLSFDNNMKFAIDNVCIATELFLNHYKFLTETQIWELCRAHLSLAKKIIQDANIANRFTFEDQVELASFHDETANEFLEAPQIKNLLNFYDKVNLARNRVSILKKILENQELMDTCEGIRGSRYLSFMAVEHIELALLIFKTKSMREKLDFNDLIYVAMEHKEIANEILSTIELCDKLTSSDLKYLGSSYVDIAKIIINTPSLLKRLDISDLVDTGSKHPDIANFILDNAQYRRELDKHHLIKLGKSHPSVFGKIFDRRQLRKKIDGSTLFAMAVENVEIALIILKNKDLFAMLDWDHVMKLCGEHIEFSKQILVRSDLEIFHFTAQLPLLFSRDKLSIKLIRDLSDKSLSSGFSIYNTFINSVCEKVNSFLSSFKMAENEVSENNLQRAHRQKSRAT